MCYSRRTAQPFEVPSMQNASGIKGRSTIKVRVFLACLAAVFSISVRADVYNEARPILEIKNGKLQGVEEYGMLAFKNIPYAAPPLGELLSLIHISEPT